MELMPILQEKFITILIMNKVEKYIRDTSMSLVGVSHSASEYFVHKTLMKAWFENNFSVQTVLPPKKMMAMGKKKLRRIFFKLRLIKLQVAYSHYVMGI